MIHLNTKNHFGVWIIWGGTCILVFKKSCFFEVPLDHKVYTESHMYMQLNTDSNIDIDNIL